MKLSTIFKNILLGLALTILIQPTRTAASNPAKLGLAAQANAFVGNTLYNTATGAALLSLAYSGYHGVRALACWAKAQCVSGKDEQNPLISKHRALIDKRDESFLKSLASVCIAGTTYGLTKIDYTGLIVHFDIGKLLASIINALSRK